MLLGSICMSRSEHGVRGNGCCVKMVLLVFEVTLNLQHYIMHLPIFTCYYFCHERGIVKLLSVLV